MPKTVERERYPSKRGKGGRERKRPNKKKRKRARDDPQQTSQKGVCTHHYTHMYVY